MEEQSDNNNIGLHIPVIKEVRDVEIDAMVRRKRKKWKNEDFFSDENSNSFIMTNDAAGTHSKHKHSNTNIHTVKKNTVGPTPENPPRQSIMSNQSNHSAVPPLGNNVSNGNGVGKIQSQKVINGYKVNNPSYKYSTNNANGILNKNGVANDNPLRHSSMNVKFDLNATNTENSIKKSKESNSSLVEKQTKTPQQNDNMFVKLEKKAIRPTSPNPIKNNLDAMIMNDNNNRRNTKEDIKVVNNNLTIVKNLNGNINEEKEEESPVKKGKKMTNKMINPIFGTNNNNTNIITDDNNSIVSKNSEPAMKKNLNHSSQLNIIFNSSQLNARNSQINNNNNNNNNNSNYANINVNYNNTTSSKSNKVGTPEKSPLPTGNNFDYYGQLDQTQSSKFSLHRQSQIQQKKLQQQLQPGPQKTYKTYLPQKSTASAQSSISAQLSNKKHKKSKKAIPSQPAALNAGLNPDADLKQIAYDRDKDVTLQRIKKKARKKINNDIEVNYNRIFKEDHEKDHTVDPLIVLQQHHQTKKENEYTSEEEVSQPDPNVIAEELIEASFDQAVKSNVKKIKKKKMFQRKSAIELMSKAERDALIENYKNELRNKSSQPVNMKTDIIRSMDNISTFKPGRHRINNATIRNPATTMNGSLQNKLSENLPLIKDPAIVSSRSNAPRKEPNSINNDKPQNGTTKNNPSADNNPASNRNTKRTPSINNNENNNNPPITNNPITNNLFLTNNNSGIKMNSVSTININYNNNLKSNPLNGKHNSTNNIASNHLNFKNMSNSSLPVIKFSTRKMQIEEQVNIGIGPESLINQLPSESEGIMETSLIIHSNLFLSKESELFIDCQIPMPPHYKFAFDELCLLRNRVEILTLSNIEQRNRLEDINKSTNITLNEKYLKFYSRPNKVSIPQIFHSSQSKEVREKEINNAKRFITILSKESKNLQKIIFFPKIDNIKLQSNAVNNQILELQLKIQELKKDKENHMKCEKIFEAIKKDIKISNKDLKVSNDLNEAVMGKITRTDEQNTLITDKIEKKMALSNSNTDESEIRSIPEKKDKIVKYPKASVLFSEREDFLLRTLYEDNIADYNRLMKAISAIESLKVSKAKAHKNQMNEHLGKIKEQNQKFQMELISFNEKEKIMQKLVTELNDLNRDKKTYEAKIKEFQTKLETMKGDYEKNSTNIIDYTNKLNILGKQKEMEVMIMNNMDMENPTTNINSMGFSIMNE